MKLKYAVLLGLLWQIPTLTDAQHLPEISAATDRIVL